MARWSTEGVQGNENALCDMITDTCQCTFGQIRSMYDSKSAPEGKHWALDEHDGVSPW